MKSEIKLCPKNFQLWVAFLLGMVVIVIAIVLFDNVSANRQSAVNRTPTSDILALKVDPTSDSFQSSNTVNTVLASGETASAWLGVDVNDITDNMVSQLGLATSEGVLVKRVIANSPAQEAGVLPGDILYEFDHREIDDVDKLIKLISKADPEDRVKLSLFRDDDRIVTYVVLEEAISNPSTLTNKNAQSLLPGDQRWGVVLSELNDQLRKVYKIPDDLDGVLVMMVIPQSAAAKAGILKGDLIRQVDKTKIDSLSDFFKAVQSDDNSFSLYVYRDDSVVLINVTAMLPQQPLGYSVAQEGIGMNRPLYVPGADQTQSGDPDDKTNSVTSNVVSVADFPTADSNDAITIADDTTTDDDEPVCKRVEELELDSYL